MNNSKIQFNISSKLEKSAWVSLKKGDMNALGELYNLYVDELFAYGMSIAPDKSLVLDGIHDLFLNLYKYRRKLADVSNIKAYLRRSLKTTLLKNSGNMFLLGKDVDKVYQLSSNETIATSHEENLIEKECAFQIKEKVNRARDLLTNNQQRVLRMRFEENKSYEEIAASTSVSIASARTIIYRALKILRGGLMALYFLLN